MAPENHGDAPDDDRDASDDDRDASDDDRDAPDGLTRRAVLRLSAFAAAGTAGGGTTLSTPAAAASRTERWLTAPRWAGLRSALRTDDGHLLTGVRTNVEDEQVGWAVKVDDGADVEWNRTYQSPPHLRETDGGEDHDGLEFALPDGDGGYLLVGWWHTESSDSRYGWLTRVDANGVPRWSRIHQRDGVNSFRDDFAGGVASGDDYLLVGRTVASEYLDEETGDGWAVAVEGGAGGRVKWQRAYDPSGTSDGWSDDDRHAEFTAVARAGDGYLLVGECSPDGPTVSTNTAAWAVRVDGDGDVRWSRTYRADRGADNEFRDVAATGDGFFVAGVSGTEGRVPELHDFEMAGRGWVAKLDANGRTAWRDAPGGDGFHAVEATADGAVFAGAKDGRAWVVRYADDGTRTGDVRAAAPVSAYDDVAPAADGHLLVGRGRHGATTDGILALLADDDLGVERGSRSRSGGGNRNGGRSGGGSGSRDGEGNRGDERSTHVFEVVSRGAGDVRYEFDVDGDAEKTWADGRVKAESNDAIARNGDGTATVSGFTGNRGYGDAYRIRGDVTRFERTGGDAPFVLRLDGDPVGPRTLRGD